jgi:hypothetical protein
MHLIYLDESGDPGRQGSPTSIYLIAGLAVDVSRWKKCHQQLAAFRKAVRDRHGLDPAREMHANEFLGSAKTHLGLGRIERLGIARVFLDVIAALPGVRVFGWSSEKGEGDVLERVASALSSDLDSWAGQGVLGGCEQAYLIIHDTFGRRPLAWYAECAPPRVARPMDDDSAASLFLQAADFVAYAMRQNLLPNSFMREHGGRGLLRRLDPVSLGFRHLDPK